MYDQDFTIENNFQYTIFYLFIHIIVTLLKNTIKKHLKILNRSFQKYV